MHKATRVTITTPIIIPHSLRINAATVIQHNLKNELRDIYIYPDHIKNHTATEKDIIGADNMFQFCIPEDICRALLDIYNTESHG